MVLVTSNGVGDTISTVNHSRKCEVKRCAVKKEVERLVVSKDARLTVCEYHLGECIKAKNRKCVLIEELVGEEFNFVDGI